MSNRFRYLLITPAKNEAALIEGTIRAVIGQTAKPVKWLIVSDGSTDQTDAIVSRHAREHPWIELFRMDRGSDRNFGGKATCFNEGYNRIRHLPHEFVGSLDADITFDQDHFAFLLERFVEDKQLGLAGAPFSENGGTYDFRFSSTDHVSGACQLFRRECFEQIGGYTPVAGGGIDVIAVLSARAKGWRTRTFVERVVFHHRPMGSVNDQRKLKACFRFGEKSYRLGYHPVWQLFRTFYQMSRKPYMVGAIADTVGYFWAMLRRSKRSVTPDLVKFQQDDQMRRLREFLRKLFCRRGYPSSVAIASVQP